MKFSLVLLNISLLILFIFSSCKKADFIEEVIPGPTVPVTPAPDTATVITPITYNRTIDVGTGSGILIIDGQKMSLQCNDLIKITAGNYSGMEIKNILSADGCPITIKNEGLVEITGDFNQMTIENIKNLTISGDGTPGLAKGFVFRDNKYRAIQIFGTLDKFTLQHIEFKNIGDMDISFQYKTLYTGSEDSYAKDLKFLHIKCDNTSQLLGTSGHALNGVITGLIKNIEIAYVDFQNSPNVSAVVYLGNAEDYNIHHNRINNVNTMNNNHNGVFSITGNGSFHNNYVSNHQGNSIRAWSHTIGTVPKNIYIYNNIVVNSRKYSAFEVQGFDASISPGKSTYANAVVFNNTVGNMNTSRDWQGNVVDVYNLKGGKCDVYNNVAFNMQDDYAFAGQMTEQVPNAFNNRYYKTSAEAGLIDEKDFKLSSGSPLKAAGSTTAFVIKDYYDNTRNQKPSMGAVE